MAFDASQFGATPVSSGFNPADFGATPIDNTPASTPTIPTPAVTTDNPQLQEIAATKGATGAFNVAQGLGIAKFGQGIATAGRVASGSINQTGTEVGQSIRDQQMVINKLQQLRAQGVPRTDLNYM